MNSVKQIFERVSRSTISIQSLHDLLEDLIDRGHGECSIFMSSDYGDYGHTEQLLTIDEDIHHVPVVTSGYSETGFSISNDGDEDDEDSEMAFVLRRNKY